MLAVTRPMPAQAENVDLEQADPLIDRPLRVLLIVESSGGGTGRHVLDLAQGLIARGCDVHLIYATARMDRIFRDRLKSIPALRHSAIPMRTGMHPSDIWVVRAVCRHVRANGPFDAIHGHSSKGGAIARLASFFTRVPAHYTLHGLIAMDPLLGGLKRKVYLTIEQALSLITARIIAVSPEEARAAVNLKLGTSRVVLVPNGVGKPEFSPRQDARQAMGVDDDTPIVGFIGRLVTQKAPEVLLRAFARAVAVAPRACLVMVGSGPMDEEMRQLATALDIRDKIRWLGERDARGVLAGFDIFAISSRKEGLPYVVLEAMSAGLPVVATASAGVESLLRNNVNGFIVPPDDATAFASGLLSLLQDPDRRAAFSAASKRRVAQFTIERMVDGAMRAYRMGMGDQAEQDHADWEEDTGGQTA